MARIGAAASSTISWIVVCGRGMIFCSCRTFFSYLLALAVSSLFAVFSVSVDAEVVSCDSVDALFSTVSVTTGWAGAVL